MNEDVFGQTLQWQPRLEVSVMCTSDHKPCASDCSGHSCRDKDPCPNDKSCAKD